MRRRRIWFHRRSVPVDLTVNYLGGGGAGSLPAKFRYLLEPRYIPSPSDYQGFEFTNGKVHEGLVRGESEERQQEKNQVQSQDLTLDRSGSARTAIAGLPKIEAPMAIFAGARFQGS